MIFKYVNQQCSLKIDSAAHTNREVCFWPARNQFNRSLFWGFQREPISLLSPPLSTPPPQLNLSSNQCLNSLISRHLLHAENVSLFGFCNSTVDSSTAELPQYNCSAIEPSFFFFFNPAEFKVQNLFLSLMQCIASVFNVFIRNAIRGRWCQHFGFVWTAFVPVQTLPYET